MKFQFTDEGQAVIDAIAIMDDETDDLTIARFPEQIIQGFSNSVEHRLMFDKTLNKNKRFYLKQERNFFIHFLNNYAKAIQKKYVDIHHNVIAAHPGQQKEYYKTLVKLYKELKTGQALKDAGFVAMAMRYQLIYLSKHEIQGLIDRNTVG